MELSVDQDRLTRELEELSAISAGPAPGVTRVVFTETDLRARKFFKELCAEAGLSVREDAVGNTFARWVGAEPDLPAVATGSHIDAIPHSGSYDGTVGVLGGLEAIRSLQRAGIAPRRSVELILFTSEEPTRFGIGCLGSRLLSGTDGSGFKDAEGQTLDEVRQAAGFRGALSTVTLPRGFYSAFVELHIEQGKLLEQGGMDCGIVEAIAAPAALRIEIEGDGGHAGAVLMPQRRDAFLAAAEMALAVEAAAHATGAIDTVATTGICDIFPRAVNSIPSKARMEIDVRDIEGARRDGVVAQIRQAAEAIATRRGVTLKIQMLNADPPAQCSPVVLNALNEACRKHKASVRKMISRAYHDSSFMSLIAPTAMLFIPCRDGMSHRPEEYATPEHIAKGALVLAETLSSLAR